VRQEQNEPSDNPTFAASIQPQMDALDVLHTFPKGIRNHVQSKTICFYFIPAR
jgi:hypothetical protein